MARDPSALQRTRVAATEARAGRRIQDWAVHPAFVLIVAGIVGLVLGLQFVSLSQRIVKSLVALSILYVFVRYPIYIGVGVFLIIYPYPAAIALGNTNFIFCVLLASVWITKVGLGLEPPLRSSLLGLPVFLLFMVHVLSLIMLPEYMDLREVASFQQYLLAAVLLYAVMTNTVTTPRRLDFIFQAITIGSLLVNLQAVLQIIAPTLEIIPSWYYVTPAAGKAVELGGRIGGVFRSHPLLSDSAAIVATLQLFLLSRPGLRAWRRLYHGGTAVLAVVAIFMSVNRGGFTILVLGILVIAWHLRRELQFSRIAIGLSLLVIVFVVAEQVTMGHYEQEITMFSRLAGTRFESLMPENRAIVWSTYIRWIMGSPLLGHGPMIDSTILGFWPHNGYLFYAYTTGLIGLSIFLWIVIKAILGTRPGGAVSWVRGPYTRGALLLVHVMLIQFALGQLRTDHQRGNVFIYLTYGLLAQASIVHRLSEEERRRLRPLTPPAGS